MSVEMMAVVLNHSAATGSEKLLLLGIANHDGDGGAWPSIATLCRYANLQERGVRKVIARLVEMGELRVHPQQGGLASTPEHRRTNLYEILVRCPGRCDGTMQHRVPPVPQDLPPLSPRTPEPSFNHPYPLKPSLEGISTEGLAPPVVVARPHSLPRGWKPTPATTLGLEGRFGTVLDIEAQRVKFCGYHANHPEKRERDWDGVFATWVARDYQEVLTKRADAAQHDDDFGNPSRQTRTSIVDAMTDQDRARERAAVEKRYGAGT